MKMQETMPTLTANDLDSHARMVVPLTRVKLNVPVGWTCVGNFITHEFMINCELYTNRRPTEISYISNT